MHPRQFSSIYAIADHGSLAAAATALGTEPSVVAGHVNDLETSFGSTFLDPESGKLTGVGQEFVRRTRLVISEIGHHHVFVILAIADHGSVPAAADALKTAPSTITKYLDSLELEVGSTLVDRESGKLTVAGRQVADNARGIVAKVEAIGSE
jgi:DNA-binding transcriptional LysR family regulator